MLANANNANNANNASSANSVNSVNSANDPSYYVPQMSFYPNPAPSVVAQDHPHLPFAAPSQPAPPMMPAGFGHPGNPHGSMAFTSSAPFAQPVSAAGAHFSPLAPPPAMAQNPALAGPTGSVAVAQRIAHQSVPPPPPPPPPPPHQHQHHQQPQSMQPQPQLPPSHPHLQQATSAREKARVTALLDINSMLLHEVVQLQAAGKAGSAGSAPATTPTTSDASTAAAAAPPLKPSPEYIECMRRLQSNLAYLVTIADRAKKSGGVPPPAPTIMTPPPHMPSMNELYARLNELFPAASSHTPAGRLPAAAAATAPSAGNGRQSASPAAETHA